MADNLLDKASILLTPTAYDNGSMLSIKPENGDGDFDFQRNGNASRVDSSGNIVTESANLPRIDYTDGCGSWLLEPQSTNLIQYSEDFSQGYWSKIGSSISPNVTISPDGTQNASKLVEDNLNGLKRLRNNAVSTSGDNTLSFFVKSAERNWILLREAGQTGAYAYFDLENGVIGQSSSAENINIKQLNNDWYKISFKDNLTYVAIELRLALSDGVASYQGDGVSGIYIYGAQVEEQSFSTSYIPTNGATSTRLQDIANNSGNSSLINSTEGVLYAEIAALADDGTSRRISLSDGSISNRVSIEIDETAKRLKLFIDGNVLQVDNIELNNFTKICGKYKANDYSLWVNGLELATLTTNSNVPSGLDRLNFDGGDGANDFYGKVKALAVYKEALTDANLRSLTYPNPVATTFDLDFDTIAEQFTFTRGSEATFVNSQGLIESTASNDAPRLDYSTGEEAFLLEPQSTNLVTYSEDFSQSSWQKQSAGVASAPVVTPNYAISPDGTLNADRVVFDINGGTTSSSFSQIADSITNNIGDVTSSIWIKSNTTSNYNMSFVYPSGNFTSIVVTTEWQRFDVTSTTTSTTNSLKLRLRGSESTSDFADVSLWGAQAEEQSYATSYIPTNGAIATRNQEVCKDATPVINSEEGVLYAEISALANDATNRTIGILGDSNNYIELAYRDGANEIRALIVSDGSVQASMKFTTSDTTLFNKVAIKWKANDAALWINGVEVLTDTILNIPSGLSELNFYRFDAADNFFGNVKDLKVYPKALADVQLEDLTTI